MTEIIPKTYNEVIRKKRCYDLTKYFEISEERLVEIYNFLNKGNENKISATTKIISLYTGKKLIKSLNVNPKNTYFDGVILTDKGFSVIPHYTSNGSSSGGSSSNNNNNNNNNNNG